MLVISENCTTSESRERKQTERERGQQKGRRGKETRTKDRAVFNLGVDGLTGEMEDVLSLRLKFVPLQWVNKSKAETDVKRFKVKLMWDVYWKWVRVEERQEEDTPEEEGDRLRKA